MTPPEKWPPSVHNAVHDEQAAIREAQAHLSRKPSQKWQRRIQQARCRIWVLMMCHMAVIAVAVAQPPPIPILTNLPPLPVVYSFTSSNCLTTNWDDGILDPKHSVVHRCGLLFMVTYAVSTNAGHAFVTATDTNYVPTNCPPQEDVPPSAPKPLMHGPGDSRRFGRD